MDVRDEDVRDEDVQDTSVKDEDVKDMGSDELLEQLVADGAQRIKAARAQQDAGGIALFERDAREFLGDDLYDALAPTVVVPDGYERANYDQRSAGIYASFTYRRVAFALSRYIVTRQAVRYTPGAYVWKLRRFGGMDEGIPVETRDEFLYYLSRKQRQAQYPDLETLDGRRVTWGPADDEGGA